MQERQFGVSVDDGDFAAVVGFRPIVLYDTRVDMLNDSLTLSQSRKELQLPQLATLSSRELDEIDAEYSSSQDHEQVATPSDPFAQTQHLPPPSGSRERGFAVDDAMFHYRALGSLRSGLAPIALLSRWHAGLAVTAFASGATVAVMRAAYRPLLLSTLNGQFERKYDAGTALLDWGDMLSVFLGLFSDCVPMYGTRRKAYITLGWMCSAVSYACVCGVYVEQIRDVKRPDAVFGRLLEAWSIVGSFALQLSWVAALALVVGFGQREALGERGGLATLFLVLWQVGTLTAHVTIGELQLRLTVANTSAIIATTSVIVLPFVRCFLHDDDEQESAATLIASTKRVGVLPALRTGLVQLWELCQEEVTYRVLLFLLVYGVLSRAGDPGVHKAFASWCGFAPDDTGAENPWVLVITSGVAVAALLHAKWRLLSTAWRQLAYVGTGVVVLSAVVQATIITTDTVRAKWFFSIFLGLTTWAKTWILVFIVLTTTEITHVGCEGVTMGLVLSSQGLGASVMNAIAEWISHATNTRITEDLIDEDSHNTRVRILFAAVAYAAVNLFAATAVPWLPRSKLEAQQLRAFGGYSRKGAAFIVVLVLVLLALAIVANLEIA
ncbi:hypothetical protein PHYPSEUDO_001794 [Phytophthora pseudosyringae]|uniref:Transmembrane protein n=1 Tax=Phytophthora pseudosyringae TaxID=221518 RepID=A0A8T1VW64_9STRA|nr:hypothetical protein PHYPSEUDO_001794 [Phytophthora pseudosyringae]